MKQCFFSELLWLHSTAAPKSHQVGLAKFSGGTVRKAQKRQEQFYENYLGSLGLGEPLDLRTSPLGFVHGTSPLDSLDGFS